MRLVQNWSSRLTLVLWRPMTTLRFTTVDCMIAAPLRKLCSMTQDDLDRASVNPAEGSTERETNGTVSGRFLAERVGATRGRYNVLLD